LTSHFKPPEHYPREVEEQVISTAIHDYTQHAALLEKLTPDDFYYKDIAEVYKLIKGMATQGKPIDLTTVWTESGEDKGVLDILVPANSYFMPSYILETTITQMQQYARNNRIMERIKQFIISDHESLLIDLEKVYAESAAEIPKPPVADTVEFVQSLTTNLQDSRIETGFRKMDNILGWLPKRHVSIIAARPSVGKTTFALNIGAKQKRKAKNVMVFSLEMGIEQINERLAAMMSSVPYGVIHSHTADADQLKKITDAMALFDSYPGRFLVYDDVYSIDTIISMIAAERPDIVFVDFVQFVSCSEGDTTNERIGNIMKAFKRAAKTYNCHICALSQLNREADKESKPSMRHLRDSGELEQYADIIIFLHRPGILNTALNPSDTTIIISKNKFGQIGEIKAQFAGAQQRFREE
jgi:replicative DNA helicase